MPTPGMRRAGTALPRRTARLPAPLRRWARRAERSGAIRPQRSRISPRCGSPSEPGLRMPGRPQRNRSRPSVFRPTGTQRSERAAHFRGPPEDCPLPSSEGAESQGPSRRGCRPGHPGPGRCRGLGRRKAVFPKGFRPGSAPPRTPYLRPSCPLPRATFRSEPSPPAGATSRAGTDDFRSAARLGPDFGKKGQKTPFSLGICLTGSRDAPKLETVAKGMRRRFFPRRPLPVGANA